MSECKYYKLEDIGCKFISGFGFKSSDYTDNGIPLIKIGNIQNRIVTVDENGTYVPEKIVNDKIVNVFLSNNDVLIAMTGQGSVGRVGRLKLYKNERALLNQRVGKFVCDEKNINIDYLYYILTSGKYQDYLFNTGAGSGQPNLSPNLILQTEIPWFEFGKQKAIAEVLSSLDDKIELLHRQNKTLEAMAETLFRQWFTEEAKEDWEDGNLGMLTNIDTGFAFKSKFYEEEGNLRVVRGKNVTIGKLRWGSDAKFWNESVEGLEKYNLHKWDIVIGMDGSRIGQNRSLVLESDLPAILAQRVARLRAKNINHQPFIWKHIYSDEFQEYIAAIHTGTSIPHISQSQIAEYDISIPPKAKIDKYSEIVQSFWNKYESNSTQIQTLENLRDTFLPKLMSGEVRVKY